MSNASDRKTALYDDPRLFSSYQQLRALDGRLNDVVEKPALISLMPMIDGAAADLGCGTGDMCRWIAGQGAASVHGYDPSEKMLAQAKAESSGYDNVTYQKMAIEQINLGSRTFQLVVSGLALHYVADFQTVAAHVEEALTPGGTFLFSVEHPLLTCSTRQWHLGDDGARLHWPVDNYLDEGPRTVSWMGLNDVPRQHRTVATYVNDVIASGLRIHRLLEPRPDHAAISAYPRLADQIRRPPFLIIRADKPL